MYTLTKTQMRRAKRHVAFTNRISKWLMRAGVRSSDARSTIAVGLADSLHACTVIRRRVNAMLATNPKSQRGARVAGNHAVVAGVQMFEELLYHLKDMRRVWERDFETRLYARVKD